VCPTRRDLVLAAFALVLSGCTLLLEAGPHDEGLVLAAADRIADGQVPYRDFWWNYGPGQAYLVGLLTAVSGPSLLVWRVVRVVMDAVLVVLVARLVQDTAEGSGSAEGSSWWPLAAGIATAGAVAWPSGPGPGVPALLLAFTALLLAPRRPGVAGALAGAAALWRPEIGLCAVVGVVLRSTGGAERAGSHTTPPAIGGFRAGPLGARAAVAAAAVAGAGYAPFAVLAGRDLHDDTLGFLDVQGLQRLPFPFDVADGFPDPNKVLEAAFPAILAAGAVLAAAWLVTRAQRRGRDGAWALAPFVAAGLAYLLARTDEFHLAPLAVALAATAGIAGATGSTRVVRAGAAALLVLIALHGIERQAGRLLHPGHLVALSGPVADGVRADAPFARGTRFVARTIAAVPGPVLVAPPRYDRVRFGAPLVNVLLGRRNPSRYDVIQPGVVTTRAVQMEIAADLYRTRTPWIVRWIAPEAHATEPNGAGRERGSRLLDDVIARDYDEVARDASFVVLRRRDS